MRRFVSYIGLARMIASLLVAGKSQTPALANALPNYLLPWDNGVGRYVSCGNGDCEHTGMGQYAWDLTGSWPVRAGSTGTVVAFVDPYSTAQGGCGSQFANNANYVTINSGGRELIRIILMP